MRGEAGVTRKTGEEPYSFDFLEKCVNNALGLYKDALNTSTPRKASLMEIALEELAKGFVTLVNMPSSSLDHPVNDLIDTLSDDLFDSISGFIETYNIKKFDIYSHKQKLKIIMGLFNFVSTIYEIYPEQIKGIQQEMLKTDFGELKDVEYIISIMERFHFKEFNKVKEEGLYVDFIENNVSPEEQTLRIIVMKWIFFVLYSSLNVFIQIYKETQLDKLFSDPKLMFGGFYEYLPENVKKMLKGDGE